MSAVQDHPDIEKIAAETGGVIDDIPVREIIREVFRNPENGTPDNISKAGCLALALKSNEVGGADQGHVAWNAWRDEFKVKWHNHEAVNRAIFFNHDYRGITIDFSEFIFGPRADFSHSTWGEGVKFCKAKWGEFAKFEGTRYGAYADFERAEWGDHAHFEGAEWEERANFKKAQWGNSSRFQSARWGPISVFEGASWGRRSSFPSSQWGDGCIFDDASWGADALFFGARWGDHTAFVAACWGERAQFVGVQIGYAPRFIGAKWGWGANFSGLQCGERADFLGTEWGGNVDFSAASWEAIRSIYVSDEAFNEAQAWAKRRGLTPDSFLDISFKGGYFLGDVKFINRHFLGRTDFSASSQRVMRDQDGLAMRDEAGELRWEDHTSSLRPQFGEAPKFHGCQFHQDTTFKDVQFPRPSGSEEAARAYRTLKLAFSEQQAIREEQRFFRLEMEEETLRETGLRRWLFKAYKHSSDYGFSIARPLLILLVGWLVFSWIYGAYTQVGPCFGWAENCTLQTSWLNYSLQQTLPLLGLTAGPKAFEQVPVAWVAAHKTLSLAALFLIGLALRNLFKLK